MHRDRIHYCKFGRHVWACFDSPCWHDRITDCPDCAAQQIKVSSIIIPVVCERCGVQRRNAEGQTTYVALAWKRGKRIVCPDCHAGEKAIDQLSRLTGSDDTDDMEDTF